MPLDSFVTRQGGWDPWMRVKTGSWNPEDSILWATQLGKIWRSTDCGQNWTDVTPNIPEPPDDFGQTPPPTLA